MGLLGFFSRGEKNKEPEEPYVPFEIAEPVSGDYDEFRKILLNHSLIMLITGKRGSGKTALGMKMLEMFNRETRRKCYAIGFDGTKLPRWIKKEDDIDNTPNNSVVLVDEGGITFSSRESMRGANKALGKIMAIARHKNLTLLMITQSSAMIDLNVLRLADAVLLKEPSLMQAKFERKAIREMYEKIKPKFEELEPKERKSRFYIWADEFEGMMMYGLPDFWSDSISRAFQKI